MIFNPQKHILGLELHQENRYTGNRQTDRQKDTQPDYRMPSFVHAHVSIPCRSPDVLLGLELLRDIQFGLPTVLNNSLMLLASYQSATIIMCVMNALT